MGGTCSRPTASVCCCSEVLGVQERLGHIRPLPGRRTRDQGTATTLPCHVCPWLGRLGGRGGASEGTFTGQIRTYCNSSCLKVGATIFARGFLAFFLCAFTQEDKVQLRVPRHERIGGGAGHRAARVGAAGRPVPIPFQPCVAAAGTGALAPGEPGAAACWGLLPQPGRDLTRGLFGVRRLRLTGPPCLSSQQAANIVRALELFVKPDVLSGENAYMCAK